jgi:hypothetical protein
MTEGKIFINSFVFFHSHFTKIRAIYVTRVSTKMWLNSTLSFKLGQKMRLSLFRARVIKQKAAGGGQVRPL